MYQKFLRVLCLLLCAVMVLGALPADVFAEAPDSCGNGLTWNLEGGTLTITGNGKMHNYARGEAPWSAQASSITNVVLGDQVKSVGDFAFADCDALGHIVLPAGIRSVGEYALADCDALAAIIFQGDAPEIAQTAFSGLYADVYYRASRGGWTQDKLDTYSGAVYWYPDTQLPSNPMHRMYNPNSGEHFYTGSAMERDDLIAAGWAYEGVGWNAPVYGGDPVHRMYNPVAGDHHYTLSWEEVEMLLGHGWQYEGVCWNAANADGTNELFRLYNPNAFTGTHHYTGSAEERDYLVSLGWIYEGIGWLGMVGSVGDVTITRGQWVQMLVDACGYPDNLVGEPDKFTDISHSEYRRAIQIADAYGLLPEEVTSSFRPEMPATREFAVRTAVNAMGYMPTEAIDCLDVNQMEDPAAVKQAVDSGLLSLEGNKFMPRRKLSMQEAEQILAVMEAEFNTTSGEETPEGLTFRDDVTVMEGDFNWETSGDLILVPEGQAAPQVGQILVFGTDKAIRVETVEQTPSGTVITWSSPELHEFLDSMNLSGEAEMDFTKFIPADGVDVEVGVSAARMDGFMDDAFDVPDTSYNLNATTNLKAHVNLMPNVKLEVSVDVAIPTVAYKFDIDFGNPFLGEQIANVKNAYVKLSEDVTVNVEVIASHDNVLIDDLVYPDYIELGSIPLVGVDGVGIVLEVDLVLTPEGKFTFQYNVHGTLGAQVLNNRPKNISALQSSTSVGLSGSLKIGPQMKLLAEIFEKDLLSFSGSAGIKAAGSVDVRSTGLVCMDAGVTAYAELSAFEDCLIDNWLEIALKYTIWDDSNSPIRIKGHWENLELVDECTYGKATIKGTVASADDRTHYIENAKIQVLDHSDMHEVVTVYSDANGAYTAVVESGTYLVKISADGYIPFESLETVGDHQMIFLETYLMVEGDEDSDETSQIGGVITNSVTGLGIPNVKLTIRKGWNKLTGDVIDTVYTNSSGRYTAQLPLGNYTVAMECANFVSNHINVAVTANGNDNCNGVMTPDSNSTVELGDMRIVLTWGDSPSDLDSHLWGPTVDGSDWYHIYYMNMRYNYNGERAAFLDVDDISYYGPETTTVYNMTPNGTYSFYVHDYTNKYVTASRILANSGAKVQVYMGEELIGQFHVPTSGVGNTWHVFDFDAERGILTGVNTFSDQSSPGMVGYRGSAGYTQHASNGLELKDYEIEAAEANEPAQAEEPVEATEPVEAAAAEEPTEAETVPGSEAAQAA